MKIGDFVFLKLEGVYGYIVKMMDLNTVIIRDTAGTEYKKQLEGLEKA